MRIRSKLIISFVCAFFGFMVAIQFQSSQEPKERDTRDLWEVRSQLQKEQKIQQQLYQQIAETEEMLEQYKEDSEQELVDTLSSSIEDLKKRAGLTDVKGSGVLIHISPIFVETELGQEYPTISADLLNRLINELNMYGATDIAVENERIIGTTPIRSVNGKTYVNNHALPSVPLTIQVLSKNPTRLLDFVQVSQSRDLFSIDYLDLTAEIKHNMTLPKYEDTFYVDELHVNEQVEAGES